MRSSFRSCIRVGAVCIAVFAFGPYAESQRVDFRDLATGNSRVRPERFHALWILTGFDPGVLQDNTVQLAGVFRAFNDDFLERVKSSPRSLQIIPTPTSDLLIVKPVLTFGEVQSAFDALEHAVSPGDVVFCYIMAHGDLADESQKLSFGAKKIPRTWFVERLKEINTRKRAELIVFVTDNCSKDTGIGNVTRLAPPQAMIWRALYFGHQGFLDLSSTAQNQYGFVINGVSVFNEAFNRALNLRSIPATKSLFDAGRKEAADDLFAQLLDTDRNGIVSWQEFESHLSEQVQAVYEEGKASLRAAKSPLYDVMEKQGTESVTIAEYPSPREN